MIAGVTGGKTLPEEIAEQIIDRTDGKLSIIGKSIGLTIVPTLGGS
jgi:hypothetical protein